MEYLRKSYIKKNRRETEVVVGNDITTLEETIVCSQDVSMPLGQNHPTNSTVVDAVVHRGASMFDDPTIVEEPPTVGDVLNVTAINEEDDVDITKIVSHKIKTPVNDKKEPPTNPTVKREEICKHFLRNKCRHGFSGRKSHEGKDECPWTHPKLCMNFLNYGLGEKGCRNKEKCEKVHPKMCRESLKSKTCNFEGDKCKFGYHLKNTVKKSEGDSEDKKDEKKDESRGKTGKK